MRPLELTVEGFKSYRDEFSFSFEDRMLFGIVGPTGAGKSSILEAMIYSLYGKTPRVERDTKKLIHSSSDSAHVRLVFDVDGVSWEVTRAIRRKGASAVVLKRFGEGTPDAVGDRAVNARIQEILGLDFQAFCSSVVLPQGEFDRFLRSTSGDRSKILKGIFRLERVDGIRFASREKAARLDERIVSLKAELGSLPADPEFIKGLKRSLKEEQARRAEIKGELDSAMKAEAAVEKAEEQLAEVEQRIAEAENVLERLPTASALEKLADEDAEKRSLLAAYERDCDKAQQKTERAEAKLEEARTNTGGEDVIARSKEMLRARDLLLRQLESQESELPELEKKWRAGEKLVASIGEGFKSAEKVVAERRVELEQLRQTHAAHEIRKDLKEGEPCPVCEQTVQLVPRTGHIPAISTSQRDSAAAEKRAREFASKLEAARHDLTLSEERFKTSAKLLQTGRTQVREADAEIATVLKSKGDPAIQIEKRENLLQKARAEFQSARKDLEDAVRALRVSTKEAEQTTTALRKHAATLIQICGLLRINPPEVDGDASGLLDAAKRAHDEASSLVQREQRKRVTIEKAVEGAAKMVEAFRIKFGVSQEAPLATALEESNSAIGRSQREIEESERALERSKEVIKEAEAITKEKSLYDRLSSDLTDHRFTAYLLDWERKLLTNLGSQKLYGLTGRYEFDDEGEFQIVDTIANTVRTPDTLSGGETFLASLALALALAEAVSLEGGRLGCFFLDEGFGSLDSEALDLALEGIEELANPDRMIGLISHVGGIQARLDDLVVLEKSEDGTTSVLQTEGPISYPTATI